MFKKTLYFDNYCGYIIAVIVEDGKITEFNFEKSEDGPIVGNVYKGRVESVLQGMQAAFVNCGLERNCYLSSEDMIDRDKYEADEHTAPSFPDLKEGDEILVQVVKPPVGKKGAKVTAHPSFVGKSLIYLPDVPFIGVSRKIDDEELRRNLAYSAAKLKTLKEGLVVRTAAPYSKHKQMQNEYAYLKNLCTEVKKAFKSAKTGDLLYTDFALPVRVLRDTLSSDINEIVVGSEKLMGLIEKMVQLYPPQSRRPVKLHNTGRDMLDELGITKQIATITSPKVDLDNGAYLIIEKTEALTVIDVNTGKFTGDYNLEQTVYHTNIVAAREIARQVRLRNIGGIVVVDFIDMQKESHKKALVEELKLALKSDKAKCAVAPMSQFGLVEFTRKRMGASPLNIMIKECSACHGSGYANSEEYIIFGIRAKLLNLLADGAKKIRLDINRNVFDRLVVWHDMIEDIKGRANSAAIYAVPHRTYGVEHAVYSVGEFEIPEDAVKLI